MSLPHIVVDVQKYLCHQDLVHLFAVVGQRHEQDLDMALWSPMLGRDEQTLRIEGAIYTHAFVIER